jgi:lysophospholipase L1-like esterase
MIFNSILCIGDSLTFGARDEYYRGYPAELSKMLNDKDPNQFWVCINEGISGERSGDLLKRIPKILNYQDAHLVLLETGTNDTRDFIPVEIFKDNLYQIVMTIRCSRSVLGNRKLILASLVSVRGPGLVCYSTKSEHYLEQYNVALKEIADKYAIPYVDLTGLKDYRIDGCHFDNKGYREVARLFMEKIITL